MYYELNKSTTYLTKKEQSVYNILKNKNWYSYSTVGIIKHTSIPFDELKKICCSLENKLDDKINFFYYNDVQYIGFESRRIDYENDKILGINKIEKLIAQGVYDHK